MRTPPVEQRDNDLTSPVVLLAFAWLATYAYTQWNETEETVPAAEADSTLTSEPCSWSWTGCSPGCARSWQTGLPSCVRPVMPAHHPKVPKTGDLCSAALASASSWQDSQLLLAMEIVAALLVTAYLGFRAFMRQYTDGPECTQADIDAFVRDSTRRAPAYADSVQGRQPQ